MLRLPRPVACALASLGCAAAIGCTGDVETPTYDFGLFPEVAHSGFNPKASFKVMFGTGATDPSWSIADPSIATIAPSPPPKVSGATVSSMSFALVTATKAGETTITMTSGGRTLTARLVIKAYSDEDLAAGKARYEDASTDPARAPCASCHAKEGGVDHSPLKMAGFDDPTIVEVIQKATYPASSTGRSATSAFAPRGPLEFTGHTWNLSEPEKSGILAHLRSLPLGGL
ncbi:MAG: hypothetical protein KF850_28830 [Labilithrix sp.]|nr:hypothetical protein [Labilithrix sp.]